ncbi:MAG: tetratricopeptide repeat protein [Verrucomicrobiae bacterium]|nr:tetratricopeptide repeat protein [Verrucomicrobiae bacterium]
MANKTSQPEAPVASFDHDQQTSSFERFLEENLKTLLIGGAVIFVGAIGYLVFDYVSASKTSKEANAFTSADSVDEYKSVISSYPSSLAAGNAQLMIGKTLAEDDDKTDEAIAAFRTFIESYADHPQRDQGMFQLASMLIKAGQKAEAVTQLDKLLSEYPDSYLAPYAKLCKGDFAFSDGDKDAAKKIYSEVLTKYAGTEASRLADQRSDSLKLDKPDIVAPRPKPLPEEAIPAPVPGIGEPFSIDPNAGDAPVEGGGSTVGDEAATDGDDAEAPAS